MAPLRRNRRRSWPAWLLAVLCAAVGAFVLPAAASAVGNGGGEGSSFEVRFTNGAIRVERVDDGGSDAREAEEGDGAVVDSDERRRLSVRLYEIEQEAIDALRALLTEEQRHAIVE